MASTSEASLSEFDKYQARSYFPELDGLRAISVLMVICFHIPEHIWDWMSGDLGVQIFFVLSGYLITMLAIREERATGQLNLQAFYVRRFFRLFPLYYFVLALYCLLIFGLGLTPQKRPLLAWALPYYLTYLQEWPFFRGIYDLHQTYPFGHTWTLGIEEKFYLVWPLLAFVLVKHAKRLRFPGTIVLAAMTLLSPICGHRVGLLIQPYTHILVGCATAFLLEEPTTYLKLSRLGRGIVPALIVVAFLALHLAMAKLSYDWNQWFRFVYSVGVAVVLVAILQENGLIQRALQWKPLVAIGRLSYGMYLIQFLVLNACEKVLPSQPNNLPRSMLLTVLACVLTVITAQVLAVTIEKPGRDLGRSLSKRLQGASQTHGALSP